MEDTSQQVVSELQLECSVLQWTLCGRYFTVSGQWYCSLNGVCCSEHYVENNSHQVVSSIAAWVECVAVNIMWKIIHNRWSVVLLLECSVLHWTLGGRYFTAGGQWYCSLNEVCCIEHHVEDNSQQVNSGIAAWMECVTVNVMWKIFHSRWTVVLQLEWSVLQWTLCGRYFTASGQWYCSLIGVCYCDLYVEDTSQQVDSGNAAWMACVTVNIMWNILQCWWILAL